MERKATGTLLGAVSSEIFIAGSALLMLLAAQWILSAAIHGANYYGIDGKMAQATILAALKYGRLFDVTGISPIEGVGSQLLPMNVWANPAYWPFAVLDRETATDVSAVIALGLFAAAVYIMMRCFDVPVVPSVIAGQLCIGLFAPVLLILLTPTVFCLTPGNAVVYAPHLIALGLLVRLEPGSWRRTAIMTIGLFSLLFYSLYLDPLWTMVNGFSYAVAFGIVTVGSLRIKTIALRVGALACCGALLLASGAADYLDTLSQYTVRVHYPELVDRLRSFELVSALTYSVGANATPFMKYFYLTCMPGWLLGLLALRGRARVLPLAALISFIVYVAISAVYLLLLNAVWVPPIPIYLEHSLCALYIAAAIAGYWGALQAGMHAVRRLVAMRRAAGGTPAFVVSPLSLSPLFGVERMPRTWSVRALTIGIAFVGCAIVPAAVANYAVNESATRAEIYYQPWPDEPELMKFFRQNIGSDVGQPLRGSISFSGFSKEMAPTVVAVWADGMQTINEYSQLVTPQAVYFLYAFLKQNEILGSLNGFVPRLTASWENFAKATQLFGTRYYASNGHVDAADQSGLRLVTLPRRRPGREAASWYVYELPHPNVGNYSPTEVVTAQSAAETIAKISEADFEFTKKAVVFTSINEPLVAARNMQVSRMRGGFHVSGHSDGTSLVILPLQYSHCLRARDVRVRIVRTNLIMAGMIFSGDLDTDIVFDYGIFSSACRRNDLADLKQLDLKIDLRMPHLVGERMFPGWDAGVARLREAGVAMGLLDRSKESTEVADQPSPEEPAPSGPVATQETSLAELPKPTTDGLALIGIQGLNAHVQNENPVVAGQAIMRLAAVPTDGRHYLAAESTGLKKDRVYRVTAWVKAPAGVTVELEVRDGLDPRDGKPANYAKAGFDPTAWRVVRSTVDLKRCGIEQGPDGWQRIWIDLPTMDGEIVLALGLVSRNRSEFKGDGRMGLAFGGVEFSSP